MLYIFQVKKKEKSENKSLNEEGLELDVAISRKKIASKYALLKFANNAI